MTHTGLVHRRKHRESNVWPWRKSGPFALWLGHVVGVAHLGGDASGDYYLPSYELSPSNDTTG